MLRYCRAYPVATLREFASAAALRDSGSDLIYVWDDLRVGVDPLDPDASEVVSDGGWPVFCEQTLGFAVPGYEKPAVD
jgi:hypothetical protein